MFRDQELPNGFQDADFEMASLQAKGARSSALKRRGICDHGWLAPAKPSAFHTGADYSMVCNHCGKVFATAEAAHREHDELHS